MIHNASQKPKVYFGMHFCPGVAEYAGNEGSFRIFLNEDTIRKMNPTFKGCPVYVQHVDEVDLQKLQEQADGYVIRSFFNEADGKTWCEFIVVSDEAHSAIKNGWKLSNAYLPKSFAPGGEWNGVSYDKQVMDAEFEHLAIVPNPRYAESIILDADEFRAYNEKKVNELSKLKNSREVKKNMFSIFKKTEVKDADLETMTIKLPKSGRELTIAQLVNEADAAKEVKKEVEKVESEAVEEKEEAKEEASLKKILEAIAWLKSELAELKKMEKAEAAEKIESEAVESKEEKEEKALKNAKDKKHFEKLKNAGATTIELPVVETIRDQVLRGKERY